MKLIELTKKFSEDGSRIFINSLMIEYLESRTLGGKTYTEIGLMGNKSLDVLESVEEIVRKSNQFTFYNQNSSEPKLFNS